MKALLGILMFLGGIFLGLYVGVWVCFVGGLVAIVDGIKALVHGQDFSTIEVVLGGVKILFAGLLGGVSAFVFLVPSFNLMFSTTTKRKKGRK